MKNLFIAGCFLLLSVVSFGQISQAECEVLQALYEAQDGSDLSDWQFPAGVNTYNMGVGSCDCSDPLKTPSYSDMGSWTGVDLNTGSSAIEELDLENHLHTIPKELFNTDNVLNGLKILRLGGSEITNATIFTNVPGSSVNVLDNLEQLYWKVDNENEEIPVMTQIGVGNLGRVEFYGMQNLKAYGDVSTPASQFFLLGNVTTLTNLNVNSCSFAGSVTAFPSIYAGSKAVLQQLTLVASFKEPSGVSTWYPADFLSVPAGQTSAWPRLELFRFTNQSVDARALEPNAGSGNWVFESDNFPVLEYLNLGYMGFTGQYPDEVFGISTLEYLEITDNDFDSNTPVLPSTVNSSGTYALKQYIAGKNIFAPTSASVRDDAYKAFKYLTNLHTLRLDACELSCPISKLELKNTKLAYFNVNANHLSGPIPEYYKDFDLTFFSVQSNFLTYCPELNKNMNSVLGALVMNDNYFSLDDVYRAAKNSECNLIARDNLAEAHFQINHQRDRVLNNVRTIDITTEEISYGSYDQILGVFNLNGTDDLRYRNSILTLSTHDMLDIVNGTAEKDGAVSYTWKRDDGITVTDAEGTIDGPLYFWEESNSTYNGAQWYCQLHLLEACATETTDDEFYEEWMVNAGRTDITFNVTEVCGFSKAGSEPNDDDEGATENISTANAKDRTGSSISSPSFTTTTHVFPNPTRGLITLESNEIIEELEVRDLSGRIMGKEHTQGHKIDYATNHLKAGTYILRFKTQSGWSTTKITKSE